MYEYKCLSHNTCCFWHVNTSLTVLTVCLTVYHRRVCCCIQGELLLGNQDAHILLQQREGVSVPAPKVHYYKCDKKDGKSGATGAASGAGAGASSSVHEGPNQHSRRRAALIDKKVRTCTKCHLDRAHSMVTINSRASAFYVKCFYIGCIATCTKYMTSYTCLFQGLRDSEYSFVRISRENEFSDDNIKLIPRFEKSPRVSDIEDGSET